MGSGKNAIAAADEDDRELIVTWQDGTVDRFGYLWLRDHARDPASFDEHTHQRELHTAGIDEHVRPLRVEVRANGDVLTVAWPDGAVADYRAERLRGLAVPDPGIRPGPAPLPWATPPAVAWRAFEDLAEAPDALVNDVAVAGFAAVRGCPAGPETVRELAARFGYVRETIFGGV